MKKVRLAGTGRRRTKKKGMNRNASREARLESCSAIFACLIAMRPEWHALSEKERRTNAPKQPAHRLPSGAPVARVRRPRRKPPVTGSKDVRKAAALALLVIGAALARPMPDQFRAARR
jgi:hypothetical protein